jgi:hypothetical protein
VFLQGGGACFDASTCRVDSGVYAPTVGGDPVNFPGLFDFTAPTNPIAGASVVYIPYCTGDVHLGDARADYDGLEIEHRGRANAMAAIEHLIAAYPDAQEILVTGISAGAVPAPLYAGALADRLPEARLTVLADGAGGSSQQTSVTGEIGQTWNAAASLPDWPSAAGVPLSQWTIPGLFVRAGVHAPEITMARIDFARDAVQLFFLALSGTPTDDLLGAIVDNERFIEAEIGRELRSFTAPGAEHTVLLSPSLYTLTVGEVSLVEWIAQLLAGDAVSDVRCEQC